MDKRSALIVGAGAGLSASLARLFAKQGMRIALAARDPRKLATLAAETNATAYACDVSKADDVAHLFAQLARRMWWCSTPAPARAARWPT
jgi:NAD(P)-dependent dehydrogenase (short-subunit alcohol dehydrogenase family)